MGEAKRRKAERGGAPAPAAPASPVQDRSAPAAPAIASGKSCGSCTTCCTVMGVPELRKRPWEPCPHVTPGRGCGIYAERPSGCRTFICGWLLDSSMGPDLKPENCHVVFDQKDEQNIFATCDPNYPDAWRAPNVLAFLHRLARAIGPNRKVILLEKGRTWFATEDAVVPADTG
jgi:hypothetical protein